MAIPNPLSFIAWKSYQLKQVFHHHHLNKLWDPISSGKSYPAGYKSFFKGAVGLCSFPLKLLWDLLVGFFTHLSPKNLSYLSMFLETWLSTVRMLSCLFDLCFPFSDSSSGICEQFLLVAIKEICKIQETKLTIFIVIKRKKKTTSNLCKCFVYAKEKFDWCLRWGRWRIRGRRDWHCLVGAGEHPRAATLQDSGGSPHNKELTFYTMF